MTSSKNSFPAIIRWKTRDLTHLNCRRILLDGGRPMRVTSDPTMQDHIGGQAVARLFPMGPPFQHTFGIAKMLAGLNRKLWGFPIHSSALAIRFRFL